MIIPAWVFMLFLLVNRSCEHDPIPKDVWGGIHQAEDQSAPGPIDPWICTWEINHLVTTGKIGIVLVMVERRIRLESV